MFKLKPQQSIERSPIRRVEKREQPEPSSVWLTAAFALLSCAAATLVTSLTLSPGAAVRPSELLITAVGLVAMGLLCLCAHWDTNRGRKPKRYEIRELPGDE
jgi:hydrogenase-4 membrane subunit HyfE